MLPSLSLVPGGEREDARSRSRDFSDIKSPKAAKLCLVAVLPTY